MSPYIKIFKVPHTDIWSNVWESCVKYESLCTLWWSTWYISHLPRLAGLCLIRYWQFLETGCEFYAFSSVRNYIYSFTTHWNKEEFQEEEMTLVFETVEQNPLMYYNSWMMAKMTHVLKQILEIQRIAFILQFVCSSCQNSNCTMMPNPFKINILDYWITVWWQMVIVLVLNNIWPKLLTALGKTGWKPRFYFFNLYMPVFECCHLDTEQLFK